MTEKDFAAPLSSDREITLDVSGGWYDAGDVGKYVCPGATAVNTLMWTYNLFSEKFSDGQNNIPESGNGIPDILDEAKYELDFILKMQDKDSGGFYLKVKSRNENDGDGDRTVWNGKEDQCLTNATADSSAILAFASTIYRDFDNEYADTLLSAAERGWLYMEENPSVYVDTTYSGEPNSSSPFWASACLYYATGNKMYEEFFLDKADDNYKSLKSGSNGHSVSDMGIYGFFTYLLCEDKDSETTELIEKKFNSWKKSVIKRYDENPWNIAINEWGFW
ncbi:MAG: glycoside hydrolase family 9 protein, partial [Oscillospiraceae bacterium]|nr:glycoside hydrolase family 9 protein [Oscillospiraceae bacterium]